MLQRPWSLAKANGFILKWEFLAGITSVRLLGVDPKANHVKDELDTTQAIRKHLAPRHAPSQRNPYTIGGSATWTDLGQAYYWHW
jgi:hypothetical protein